MRFRLRTLLIVVAIIASGLSWIAWQKRIVDKRQECARLLYDSNEGMVVSEGAELSRRYKIVMEGNKSRRISLVRRWLGDENAEAVLFVSSTRIDPSVLQVYPEADVWLFP